MISVLLVSTILFIAGEERSIPLPFTLRDFSIFYPTNQFGIGKKHLSFRHTFFPFPIATVELLTKKQSTANIVLRAEKEARGPVA